MLDLQAVQEAFPLTTVATPAEPAGPDDGGNDPSEDVIHSSSKETQASPVRSTHRVDSSSEAQRLAVEHEAAGDDDDVSKASIRHA